MAAMGGLNTNSQKLSDDQLLKLFHELASPQLKLVVRRMTEQRLTKGTKAKELHDALAIAIMKLALVWPE